MARRRHSAVAVHIRKTRGRRGRRKSVRKSAIKA